MAILTDYTWAQRTGDKTPADLIIFAATDLKVDNSNLTGESEAQERFGVPEGSKHRPVEAENLVCKLGFSFTYLEPELIILAGLQLYFGGQR